MVSPHLHDGELASGQPDRWTTVLAHLTAAIPPGAANVLIDGADPAAALLADRLAAAVRATGRPCLRLTGDTCTTSDDGRRSGAAGTVVIAHGPRWRADVPTAGWQLTVRVRSRPDRGGNEDRGDGDRGGSADTVVDLLDPSWPVIRHLDGWYASHDTWYRTETQAFFAARATTWDTRFGEDLPAYATAIAEADLPTGATIADVGCGTGRAFTALREAVGPTGTVLGVDLTPQMLAVARPRADAHRAGLVLADARHLPIATAAVDAVLAAGLIMHLPDSHAGLGELARVTRAGGRLILFHPTGRVALAARHGRTLRPDEPLAEQPLRDAAHRAGWYLDRYDDAPHRFLALATRRR